MQKSSVQLISQFTAPVRGLLILTVVCSVLATGVTIGQMALLSGIVNAVFLQHQALAQVFPFFLLFLGLIVTRAALTWGREVGGQQAAIRVKGILRARLFDQLLRLGPAFSKSERTGELVATLSEGVERLDAYVSRYQPQMIISVAVPLLILAVVFPLDWISALLLLVTGPIIPLLMIMVGSYAEKQMQRQWLALARMSAHFLDTLQGLATLKIFGRASATHARVARISDSYRIRTMGVLRIAFLSGAVLEFMVTVAISLVAVTLGVRLIDHGIAFEQAFFVLLLTPEFYRPLRDLGTHRHAGMEGKAALERMAEILEIQRVPSLTPERVGAVPCAGPGSVIASRSPNGIELEACPSGASAASSQPGHLSIQLTDITYTYPDQQTPALQNITLSLPARSCTALVGRSGAGKSTLANLLLRFVEPASGTIAVNGVPLSKVSPEDWRAWIALVSQRPYLFYGTVRDNIRLAQVADDDAIERAAEQAGALEFIKQLPQGFATPLGEQGLRLSAGQAQRIAIARAFLKDAPLLILDEPTSSLDPESESLIRRALERLMRERTVLLIAHRYNTIAAATQVAVLENGRLVEVGAPAELLRAEGAYARLLRVRNAERGQG